MPEWIAAQIRGFPLLACGRNSLSLPLALNFRTLPFRDCPSYWFTYFLCPLFSFIFLPPLLLPDSCGLSKSLEPLTFFLLMPLAHTLPLDNASALLYYLLIRVLPRLLRPCRERWGAVLYPIDSRPQCDYFFKEKLWHIREVDCTGLLLHCFDSPGMPIIICDIASRGTHSRFQIVGLKS